jgi:hypothetical protein
VLFTWITVPSGTSGKIVSKASLSSKLMVVYYGALWDLGELILGLTAGEPLIGALEW